MGLYLLASDEAGEKKGGYIWFLPVRGKPSYKDGAGNSVKIQS